MKAKKRGINWKVLIASLVLVFIVAGIGSSFTKIDSWYYANKPAITPPSYVFPIVWTTLFILIAISLYFSWISSKNKGKVAWLYGINFVLNMLWSLLFFKLKMPALAFVELVILWISIFSLVIYNWRINRKAAYLLLPYLIWVTMAGILNFLFI